MKKPILLLAAVTFIAGTMYTACDTPKDNVVDAQRKVEAANERLEQATEDYLADIERYRSETNEKIAKNNSTIDSLKASVDDKDAATKAEYWKKIAVLENKNGELKARMDNYKADGKDKWEAFKVEFNNDMNGLGTAFKNVTVKNTK